MTNGSGLTFRFAPFSSPPGPPRHMHRPLAAISGQKIMRRLILTIAYFGTVLSSTGQEIKIERATAKDLLVSAYSLHSVTEFNGRQISVKLIEVQSIRKHPDNDSQDATISDLLLIIRELTDDKTSMANFWVRGQFFNPKNFEFNPADKVLSFQHGTEKNPKSTKLVIGTKGIKVKV